MADAAKGWPSPEPASPSSWVRQLVWIVVLSLGLLAALGLFVYDPDAALVGVVERERPDIVRRVEYTDGNFLDPPTLRVEVRPDASVDERHALACDYLIPLVQARAADSRLEVWVVGDDLEAPC